MISPLLPLRSELHHALATFHQTAARSCQSRQQMDEMFKRIVMDGTGMGRRYQEGLMKGVPPSSDVSRKGRGAGKGGVRYVAFAGI